MRRAVKATLIALSTVVLVGAGYAIYCGVLIWSGNFHAVEKGAVYRSAQLSKAQFAHEIEAHHIRSVLNLRGPNPDDAWYRDELVVTQEHGASHYDVGISADNAVTPDKIAKILAVLRDARNPSSFIACLARIGAVLSPHFTSTPFRAKAPKWLPGNSRFDTATFHT
jgi:hypothetical protein